MSRCEDFSNPHSGSALSLPCRLVRHSIPKDDSQHRCARPPIRGPFQHPPAELQHEPHKQQSRSSSAAVQASQPADPAHRRRRPYLVRDVPPFLHLTTGLPATELLPITLDRNHRRRARRAARFLQCSAISVAERPRRLWSVKR